MAFYQSNHYENSRYYEYDSSEYALIPYHHTSNSTPYQAYNGNQVFSYYPTPDYSSYDPTASTCCRISHSTATFTPNYITLYDQSPDSHPSQTQFIISYSVSDFNTPEFEEYDPKPYVGGYDISATYGEPLPPSDKTCYPRSSTSSVDPIPLPLAPATLPSEPEQSTAFEHESKPRDLVQDENTNIENGNDAIDETSGENGYYEHGKQRSEQVPPGYGLEAMDICESLFGPWPCLTRSYGRGQDQSGVGDYGGHGEGKQWNVAAVDYLFGSTDPYAGRDSGLRSYEDGVYAYQRGYYQENTLHQQVEYDSWFG